MGKNNCKKRSYGLIWEEEAEEIVEKCKTKPPILSEIKELSVIEGGFCSEEHVLIEGDNYPALVALLQEYKGKVDIIYIDPPYNTKNSTLLYNDRIISSKFKYKHSMWLSFMEKRLRLAKEFLKEDGVIFISIDDNELAQLKILCDEIFDEKNFICNFIRQNKTGAGNDTKKIAIEYDYMLCYAKNKRRVHFKKAPVEKKSKRYPYEDKHLDKRGRYYLREYKYRGKYSPALDYAIIAPDGEKIYAGDKFGPPYTWRWSFKKYKWALENDFIVFKKTNGKWSVYIKQYEHVNNKNEKTNRAIPFRGIIKFLNADGWRELKSILGEVHFKYPKPVGLIKFCLNLIENKNAIVLDFFAGSGTTGQAVLELNKEDGGNRKFILITNNENNICSQICYPRIKNLIKGYKDQISKEEKEGIKASLRYFRVLCE